MLYLFLFVLVMLGVLAGFTFLRKSHPKRHWSNQTNGERALLSVLFAGIFQFLFLLPGWLIAVSILGYYGGRETQLENLLFALVTLTSNTVIYFPFFYLLLGWLFSRQRKKAAKMH